MVSTEIATKRLDLVRASQISGGPQQNRSQTMPSQSDSVQCPAAAGKNVCALHSRWLGMRIWRHGGGLPLF